MTDDLRGRIRCQMRRCLAAMLDGDESRETLELQRLDPLIAEHKAARRLALAFPGGTVDASRFRRGDGKTATTHGVPWMREEESPTDPDASAAASLIRDDEPILSAERDQRPSEAP